MIRLIDLTIHLGGFTLKQVNLAVPGGAYGVLTGRTGSGKTSLLETIVGLRAPAAGSIELDGRDVTHLRPAERGIGYVPQDGALFPTMRVRDNLAFALTVRKAPPSRIRERIGEVAALLDISRLLDRYPAKLSGGEKQRVALGRALAFEPKMLLLDEPLSALDEDTRRQMYQVLRDMRQGTGVTVLHVTHNREDAAALAEHQFLLDEGRIVEQDPPGRDEHPPENRPAPTRPPELPTG